MKRLLLLNVLFTCEASIAEMEACLFRCQQGNGFYTTYMIIITQELHRKQENFMFMPISESRRCGVQTAEQLAVSIWKLLSKNSFFNGQYNCFTEIVLDTHFMAFAFIGSENEIRTLACVFDYLHIQLYLYSMRTLLQITPVKTMTSKFLMMIKNSLHSIVPQLLIQCLSL